MQFQLITPEREFYSGEVNEVSIPGTEGDFGVLPGHAPLISTLRPGVVTIYMQDGAVLKVAVLGGVAEATPERCSVLAETAKSLKDVTRAEAEAALAAAQKAEKDAIHDEHREQAVLDILLWDIVLESM